jgi:hypothetical protein
VLEAQYIVAAVPLVVIACTVLVTIRLGQRFFMNWWPAYYLKLSRRRQIAAAAGLFALTAVGSIAFVLSAREPSPLPTSIIAVAALITLISALFFYAIAPISIALQWDAARKWQKRRGESQEPEQDTMAVALSLKRLGGWIARYYRHQAHVNVFFLPAVAGLVLVVLYLNNIYYRIPQSLGGARPRCAEIDFSAREVSPETRKVLFTGAQVLLVPQKVLPAVASLSEGVIRSKPLKVLFVGSDILIVRVAGSSEVILEMDRKVIKSIRWCD